MSSQAPASSHCTADCGWTALVKTVEELAATETLGDIIETVRGSARAISGSDGVCFVLREGPYCHYVDEDAVAPLWKGRRFPLETCISGWCMLHDETVVVPDIFLDSRIPHDAYRPTFVKSLVVVPVRVSEPVAAIGFYWGQIRNFNRDELALVEALGRSTSAALNAVQSRERLAESERRLAMALDVGGLGVFEIDLAHGDLVATTRCRAILGYEPEDKLSRDDVLASVHPADREEAAKMFGLVPMAGPPAGQDVVYRLQNGRHIELQGRLMVDVDGRPCRISGVARDVTERIEAKERLDNMRAEMLRASRLNDLGAMASALAHELNQPLAAGSNYLKAAERLLAKDPAKAMDAMAKAGGQFVRTKEIIQRIRGFVGQGGSVKAGEDIALVCREVLELMRITTRHEGVQVHLKVETGLPRIEIDKVQIQQVLVNLLRNAVEATASSPSRQVILSVSRVGEAIELRMHDSGPGLAPEIAQHLFQPFHSTKEGGMGVGLSLCRKIVDSHGGKLWYETGTDGGAIFCFTLPLAA